MRRLEGRESRTGTDTITSDPNGNITAIGDKTLTYNQDNRLIRVEENGSILGEYTYNGLGQRVVKVENGATTTVFHHDFDGNIIAESDLNANFAKEYLYRGESRLAMVDGATNDTYFYLNDRLGTPQMMTNQEKVLVWGATYKPFGQATVDPNSTVTTNFRFPGQYLDQETGLHYNYHRYYDPRTGRHVTPDPIGLDGGINLFVYVQNNPVNWTDPYGLLLPPWHFGISLVAALNSGMSIRDSLSFAWNATAVDWASGSQGFGCEATVQHAMAGMILLPGGEQRRQTPKEAINAAKDFIEKNKTREALPKAAHAAQDLATPRHAGQPWTGYGNDWNTVFHFYRDLDPTFKTIKRAYQDTMEVLK